MYFDFKLYFSEKYRIDVFQKQTTWSFPLQFIYFDPKENASRIFFQ